MKEFLDRVFPSHFQRQDRLTRQMLLKRRAEYAAFGETKLKKIIEAQKLEPATIDEAPPYGGFDRTEYKLTTFRDLTFGKAKAANVDELALVRGVTFYYCEFAECTFSNLRFEACRFVGCRFIECYTEALGAVFQGCDFFRVLPGKKSVDDMFSSFTGCEMTVRFIDCDLTQAVLEETNFYFSQLKGLNLGRALLVDCGFDTVEAGDCDLRGARIVGTKFIDFAFEDLNRQSKVDRHSFFGEIKYDPQLAREVKFAADAYSQFNELFERNKVAALSGEYFYLFKQTELRYLTGAERVVSWLGYVVCGFGERPLFALFVSMGFVVFYAATYVCFGINANGEVMGWAPTFVQPLPEWKLVSQSLHFSMVTFSTTGYGNVTPLGWGMLTTAMEMVTGIVMVGIWVSTLVRKMTR